MLWAGPSEVGERAALVAGASLGGVPPSALCRGNVVDVAPQLPRLQRGWERCVWPAVGTRCCTTRLPCPRSISAVAHLTPGRQLQLVFHAQALLGLVCSINPPLTFLSRLPFHTLAQHCNSTPVSSFCLQVQSFSPILPSEGVIAQMIGSVRNHPAPTSVLSPSA